MNAYSKSSPFSESNFAPAPFVTLPSARRCRHEKIQISVPGRPLWPSWIQDTIALELWSNATNTKDKRGSFFLCSRIPAYSSRVFFPWKHILCSFPFLRFFLVPKINVRFPASYFCFPETFLEIYVRLKPAPVLFHGNSRPCVAPCYRCNVATSKLCAPCGSSVWTSHGREGK